MSGPTMSGPMLSGPMLSRPTPAMPLRPGAFFDVDETLITSKSMLRLLGLHFEALGRSQADCERALAGLRALSASGASRDDVQRAYFRLFAGHDASAVGQLGLRWFHDELARGCLFHQPVLRVLRRHAVIGDLIILVSGSFGACLDPIARYLGADGVLCSRPAVRDGRYTGTIAVPMVGSTKAAAVRAEAAARGIDLAASFAYGDHVSDLPVLSLVGNPVVVGDDRVLAAHAAEKGWARLPGVHTLTGAATE
jgi:HAD superfamily hydrolase (TIGR01490 family)